MDETGEKHDSGKLRWSLLPLTAVEKVVAVLEFGARKYAVDNWKIIPNAKERYLDACIRHVMEIAKGNWIDNESGLPHAAHAICCLLFLIWFSENDESNN